MKIEVFDLDEVLVTDKMYIRAKNLDIEYIKKFDKDRVLAGFRKTAGLDTNGSEVYGGWENSLIAGHCLGHYFSAAAQAVKAYGDLQLKQNLECIIDGLLECQKALLSGFLSAAVILEKDNVYLQFDIEEGKTQGKTWVPWYALHKVLQGILDVYIYTGYETAKEVAVNLGDWVTERVMTWGGDVRKRILRTEYGGMNDVMYSLYAITGNERYKMAAQQFDDVELYEHISNDENALFGIHANATIPKVVGAVNRVLVVMEAESTVTATEEQYLEFAEKIWGRIVGKYSYITGGISDMEHFGNEGMLDSTRTMCNCESCCAHNMLKLSRGLYRLTGRKKYMDYYENTLRNAIMGAINPYNGATTYFSPMATGYYKVFGSDNPEKNKMWCCNGTGMENYTKLGDSIYFKSKDNLWVNQYVSSKVYWKEKGVYIEQYYDMEEQNRARLVIKADNDKESTDIRIFFRKPDWMCDEAKATVVTDSSDVICIKDTDDYICIEGNVITDVEVLLELPVKVEAVGLPDNENVLAFRYGATVLAAKLGKYRMNEETWAGIDVTAAAWKFVGNSGVKMDITYADTIKGILETEYLKVDEEIQFEEFKSNIHRYLLRKDTDKGMEFILTGTNAREVIGNDLIFVPYNQIVDERYGIYWYFN